MGAWGPALYSDDFALDLKPMVAALARLPLDGPAILDHLRRMNPCADDSADEQHTVFWLVVADQFARRGVDSPDAIRRALDIIATGRDLDLHRDLGMEEPDLRARKKHLAALAAQLRAPRPSAARKTLREPQPLLLERGTAWTYPAMHGRSRNPYFATAEKDEFVPDGWGAMLVLDTGRAFDWLAWYFVAPVAVSPPARPTLRDIAHGRLFVYQDLLPDLDDDSASDDGDATPTVRLVAGPGTLSPSHFKRLGLELLGSLPLDPDRLPRCTPDLIPAAAASDICLSNLLNTSQLCALGPPLSSIFGA